MHTSRHFSTAEELWEALSPTRTLFQAPSQVIYRGQADARWKLVPTALRSWPSDLRISQNPSEVPAATEQIFLETRLLEEFVRQCDRVGLRVPGDSIAFRLDVLNSQKVDPYLKDTCKWPNPDLFETMAFAQHHGVPTRLLDWCRSPYVAAYFASSAALRRHQQWSSDDRLAIWAFNIEVVNLYWEHVELVRVPGAISGHLAAQSGLFTVQKSSRPLSRWFESRGLEEEISIPGRQDLLQLTVPVRESEKFLHLCDAVGISAVTLHPGPDGAGKAVIDSMHAWAARRQIDNES
jgi:hypothetical protein